MPIGVTLIGPAVSDARLASDGDALQSAWTIRQNAGRDSRTGLAWSRPFRAHRRPVETIEVAVVGAI